MESVFFCFPHDFGYFGCTYSSVLGTESKKKEWKIKGTQNVQQQDFWFSGKPSTEKLGEGMMNDHDEGVRDSRDSPNLNWDGQSLPFFFTGRRYFELPCHEDVTHNIVEPLYLELQRIPRIVSGASSLVGIKLLFFSQRTGLINGSYCPLSGISWVVRGG